MYYLIQSKVKLLSLLSVLLLSVSAYAQVTVSGTVSSKEGEPLTGANIVVKGTTYGTVADMDGRYSLSNLDRSQVLVFSYLGYVNQEVAVGSETIINIVLAEDAISLDNVVITALGIKRAEKALSYNVQTVGADDMTRVKSANLVNSLSGKVAGVTINAGSSGVGGASKVVMRGSKSIAQSNNALYVIDGIPMYNMQGEGATEFGSGGSSEAIADLNPEDIESISVLTGAAAAALYGNQGANGAIVINTRKGAAGKVELTFSSNTEVLSPFVLPSFQNRYGTGNLSAESGSTIRSWGKRLVPENSYGYSPAEDFFRTGTIFTNAISLSTGTDKNQTYFSASSVRSDGIVPNNQYDRYNFTFRNTTHFLNDKMTLDVGGSYIMQQDQNMINQGVYSNPVVPAYLFPRGDDFGMTKVFERYDAARGINVQYWPQGEGDLELQNPYWAAYRNLKNNDRKHYLLNAGLSDDVLEWLNIVGRVRMDNSHNDFTDKRYASTDGTFAGTNGFYETHRSYNSQTYADGLININKTFDNLSFVVNIGSSISDMSMDALKVYGNLRDDGIPNVFNVFQLDKDSKKEEQEGWHTQSQAVFASAEVGYKSTYYLTLTGRNDWESALAGTETSSFFYPSVGLSTVLSQILTLPEQINYLKVRAAYTKVGTPIPRNISIITYPWDASTGSWKTQSVYPIRVFKPESTTSWEVGLTTKLFHHFNLDLSWYHTNTINQTFEPQISVSSGYSTIYMQTGNVRNVGVESKLSYANTWSGLSWSSDITFSLNRNKIVELVKDAIHPETGEVINKDRLDIGGLGRARYILTVDGTLGDLYSVTDLLRDSKGYIYVDAAGNLQTENVDEGIYLGSVFPKFNLSWKNDLSWKNISLGFQLAARVGGVVYSATQANLDLYGVSEASAVARDQGGIIINGGDVIDANTWYTTIGAQDGIPQYYTYSATNIRLQEASLGYTLPQKVIKVADVTLSVVGRNLWMIYNKAPFDPEAVASTGNYYQGIDKFMTPSLRNIGLNLRVKF